MSNYKALGLIETFGIVFVLEAADAMCKAADKMLKAANVELVSYENIGSTLVTIMVKGDVAAVRASVEAGAEAAAAVGKLTAQNVMPRPIKDIGAIVSIYDIDA
ncbi:MAG TPA: BMC domain-containing protein [Clostridiaceae bacterium]|nr:BMC domain-containing protein [Clostridiaceae bacterium]